MNQLLEDILVVDFSQFLSGPSAGLRMADMGARVIKVEREAVGDICRVLYVSDVKIDGDESTIFHAINRNKESYCADIKDAAALDRVKKLVAKADVVIHNFRPGVMQRLGLDYDRVKALNPAIVYGEISGYGDEGEWKELPGQDLLLQAVSGAAYLSGDQKGMPVPMGVAVVDIIAGTHLVQGLLAALLGRMQTGLGSLVQVSMMESILDFQFDALTAFLNKNDRTSPAAAAHAIRSCGPATQGVFKTRDDFIAIGYTSVAELYRVLQIPDQAAASANAVKTILNKAFVEQTTAAWLNLLRTAGIECAEVYDYSRLLASELYQSAAADQRVHYGNTTIRTTRCPARVDGALMVSPRGAPFLGAHNEAIDAAFGLYAPGTRTDL